MITGVFDAAEPKQMEELQRVDARHGILTDPREPAREPIRAGPSE
jgi:hypothetical protein